MQADLNGSTGYGVIGGRKGTGSVFNGGGVQGLSDNGYALQGLTGGVAGGDGGGASGTTGLRG